MVRMNLDGAWHGNKIGGELAKLHAKLLAQLGTGPGQVPVREAEKCRSRGAEVLKSENALALAACPIFLAGRRVPSGSAVGRNDDADLTLLGDVLGDQPAAADHLIIRMWRQDEEPLAAELGGAVRNHLLF